MAVVKKTSEPVGRRSPLVLVLSSLAILFSIMFLANIVFVLKAARLLDEVGAQSASGAAQSHSLANAKHAIDLVLERHKPDGFFLREPIKSEITFYWQNHNSSETSENGKSASPSVPTQCATVKTSLLAWIPIPQLFIGGCENLKVSDPKNPNLVRFSALHTSPCLTLYDETQKNGRSSI